MRPPNVNYLAAVHFWPGREYVSDWFFWSALRIFSVLCGCTRASAPVRCSWQGRSGRVGADDGDERVESRSILQPLRIPPLIFVVMSADWLFCGGYKWVSRFEMPAFPPSGQESAEWSRCLRYGVPETVWLLCDEAQQAWCAQDSLWWTERRRYLECWQTSPLFQVCCKERTCRSPKSRPWLENMCRK